MIRPIIKIFFLAAGAVFFAACADCKAQQEKLMNSIMATHERVMGAEDKLIENKMLIDSLLKTAKFDPKDSTAKKAEMRLQDKKLTDADEAMDKWMHEFDPHNNARTGEAKLKYLQDQNRQINSIDTQISSAVKTSAALLQQLKNK